MAVSQNGWRANDRSVIATKTVPGTNVRLPVRHDAVGDLLMEVAAAWHRLVEPITGTADDWGYAERQIRGGSALSNHASGTAIDLNATKHPLGVRGTFSAAQRAQLQRIADATGGVVRFGEFYNGRVDGMHAEINDGRTLADCERALAAMRRFNGGATPAPPAPAPASGGRPTLRVGSKGEDVRTLQDWSNWYAWRPALPVLAEDGVFGSGTEAVVKQMQGQLGVVPDGVVGDQTWAALGKRGFPAKR